MKFFAIFFASFLTLLIRLPTRLAAQTKPNIVLILADDLGYGDVGVYGQQKIKTPHIDALAKEGLRFTRFYCGTAVCAPSRSSLLTGQHTGHTPIRGNIGVKPEGQWPLPGNTVTIATLLKSAGYSTGCFGKWGLGFIGTSGDPLKQGFDRFYGYNCQTLAHDYFPDHLWNNEQRVELSNTHEKQTIYSAQLIHEQAMQFIRQHQRQPFFLLLAYTLPHAALQLPKDDTLYNYYKKLFNEKPVPVAEHWNGKGYEPQAYPHAAYAAMVGKLDAYVGEVQQQLKVLGLDKNTMILFASDNGPHREGGNDPAFFNSNGGLRGIKRDLYEGGIRSPFIAWWPGTIQAGTQSNQVGAFWDLLPTFAALAGIGMPANNDGISMLPTLLARGKQQQHDHLYWEFHEQNGKQAVLFKNWKGIRLNVSTNSSAPIELYDLEKDPAETVNVAAQHPDIVKEIDRFMKQDHVETPDFPLLEKAKKNH
ncbi:arylsulfatase [Niabella soli]|uniref:Arylsulfatase n=1 Tax=Niabella soli DSM 19437 TaxID=929713 RepID=W0EWI1_9BACT|nr:arylsulfatase [Niabella soli]AHF15137.1 arylsulfatase [Niabella soli DSM 19437]